MSHSMLVMNSHGDVLTAGLPSVYESDTALTIARRIAARRGESVWLAWSCDDTDTDEYSGEGMKVAP